MLHNETSFTYGSILEAQWRLLLHPFYILTSVTILSVAGGMKSCKVDQISNKLQIMWALVTMTFHLLSSLPLDILLMVLFFSDHPPQESLHLYLKNCDQFCSKLFLCSDTSSLCSWSPECCHKFFLPILLTVFYNDAENIKLFIQFSKAVIEMNWSASRVLYFYSHKTNQFPMKWGACRCLHEFTHICIK